MDPKWTKIGSGQKKKGKVTWWTPPRGARLGARMEPNVIFIQLLSELFGYRVGDRMCTLKTYQKAAENKPKSRNKLCQNESRKALREILVSASFFGWIFDVFWFVF